MLQLHFLCRWNGQQCRKLLPKVRRNLPILQKVEDVVKYRVPWQCWKKPSLLVAGKSMLFIAWIKPGLFIVDYTKQVILSLQNNLINGNEMTFSYHSPVLQHWCYINECSMNSTQSHQMMTHDTLCVNHTMRTWYKGIMLMKQYLATSSSSCRLLHIWVHDVFANQSARQLVAMKCCYTIGQTEICSPSRVRCLQELSLPPKDAGNSSTVLEYCKYNSATLT